MMTLFYHIFIESDFSFCTVLWYVNLSLSNKNGLNCLVKVSSKVTGVGQVQLSDIYNKHFLRKVEVIQAY